MGIMGLNIKSKPKKGVKKMQVLYVKVPSDGIMALNLGKETVCLVIFGNDEVVQKFYYFSKRTKGIIQAFSEM
jgi:hypothetical protein